MTAIRIRTRVDSETLYLPELRPLIGQEVEIIVLEEKPSGNTEGVVADTRCVLEMVDAVMSDLPEEALQCLPTDGAEQHDHYLYGAPNRKS